MSLRLGELKIAEFRLLFVVTKNKICSLKYWIGLSVPNRFHLSNRLRITLRSERSSTELNYPRFMLFN